MKNLAGKVTVVMPAYNEGGRIASSIEEVARTFNDFGCSWELLVMDDGSTDNTYQKAKELTHKFPGQLIVKKNLYNMGKGRALKKSLRYVSGEITVFIDADMDLHPRQIETLFDIMRLNNADIVIGSKMHPNSVVHYPLGRKIISWIYYMFVRVFFGLPCRDTQTGLKLFRTDVLRKVFPRILVKKFAFDLEVLVNAHHLKYVIKEAPIVLNHQRFVSRISLREMLRTGIDTLAVYYRMYILKYYDHIDHYRRKGLAKAFRRMRK